MMADAEAGTGGDSGHVAKRNHSDEELEEKKQRMFKYARDKDGDKAESKLRNEIEDVSEEQKNKLFKEKDGRDNMALHYAAKAGNLEVCKILWNEGEGTDINSRGQDDMNILQFPARYGDESREKDVWKCMEWIIDVCSKEKVEKDEKDGYFRRRIARVMKKEKEVHFDIRETDQYDNTILHLAIQNTNWDENPIVVTNLIEMKSFDIKDLDAQGNTSLHLAAQFDKQEKHKILDIFLENESIPESDLKYCIETRNHQGKTPLHIACSVGNHESVQQLVHAGKKVEANVKKVINSPDYNDDTPLELAIERGDLEMMETLMEDYAEVSDQAIHCAARLVTVQLQYSYCKVTVQLLYNYCTVTVQLLYSYCAVTVQLQYSYSTATTVQPQQYSHKSTATIVQPQQYNHNSTATTVQPQQYSHNSTATTVQPQQYFYISDERLWL